MKNRSSARTRLKKQSSEKARFKKRSIAMYKNSSWSFFQMDAFIWSVFETRIGTWWIFYWWDRSIPRCKAPMCHTASEYKDAQIKEPKPYSKIFPDIHLNSSEVKERLNYLKRHLSHKTCWKTGNLSTETHWKDHVLWNAAFTTTRSHNKTVMI